MKNNSFGTMVVEMRPLFLQEEMVIPPHLPDQTGTFFPKDLPQTF